MKSVESRIALGAQDTGVAFIWCFHWRNFPEMLKNVDVKYVIIGHSERRTYHKESDEFIAQKFGVLKS